MGAQVILVMGVSGSGKTTVGQALARRLGWAFADADDHHPQSNRAKMGRGEPLTDADREPWLLELRGLIEKHLAEGRPLVLACSALKAAYRLTLGGGLQGLQVVFLSGPAELIAERMRQREHFMPVGLLHSQLATLEPPEGAIRVDIGQPIDAIVSDVLARLR